MKQLIKKAISSITLRPYNGRTHVVINSQAKNGEKVISTYTSRLMPDSYTKPMDISLRQYSHLSSPVYSVMQQAFVNSLN